MLRLLSDHPRAQPPISAVQQHDARDAHSKGEAPQRAVPHFRHEERQAAREQLGEHRRSALVDGRGGGGGRHQRRAKLGGRRVRGGCSATKGPPGEPEASGEEESSGSSSERTGLASPGQATTPRRLATRAAPLTCGRRRPARSPSASRAPGAAAAAAANGSPRRPSAAESRRRAEAEESRLTRRVARLPAALKPPSECTAA